MGIVTTHYTLHNKVRLLMASLSLSAVRQILTLARRSMEPEEEEEVIKKIEETAKKFDPSGKGELSDKAMFNVLKIQNKIDCKQEQVFGICSHLPRTRAGKMRIEEFINLPIISEETLNAIDRNKDGFLTKGEIKLTN